MDDTTPQRRQSQRAPTGRQVGALARWETTARQRQPGASEDEIRQLAEALRAEHFRLMGNRSAESRRGKDGQAMTASATSSPMHPNSPQRWLLLARQQHPRAAQATITRIAAELRAAHYRRIWETRRARAGAKTP